MVEWGDLLRVVARKRDTALVEPWVHGGRGNLTALILGSGDSFAFYGSNLLGADVFLSHGVFSFLFVRLTSSL
ncbi:MAG: hypothetical protein AN486_10570 [Anabaena sp. AL93]|nr:MAG: hypothetical protein AN486_10570 [Anabaena sp. AL93]